LTHNGTSESDRGFLISSYREWVAGEKVPLHQDFAVDLRQVDVAPWGRFGCNGAVVNVAGRGDYLDMWLLEVPPGGSTTPQHHLFEAVAYIISGRGTTTVQAPEGERSFEWGPKSMFAIPLNGGYRLYNTSGTTPARIALTTAFPIAMNIYRDAQFLFGTDYTFRSRFETAGFDGNGSALQALRNNAPQNFWVTNFVPDLGVFNKLEGLEWRGKASKGIMFLLADGVLHAHMSEIPVGSYKMAHRHMGGTHIYPVTGRGYSLLWNEGETERRRVDWEHGCVYSPPDNMYHQHFNLSDEPSRYFAVKFGNYRYPVTARMTDQFADFGYSEGKRLKKTQIEYRDEDPAIRELYLEEIAKAGLPFTLDEPAPAAGKASQ
jgi:mannose-6-phosphate isomerase-like protein (cupin superfamily)